VTVDTTGLPIGQALKVERTIAGVSLTKVAEAVGVSIGHLSRIESGDRTASPELVDRIRTAILAAAEAVA
jgi:transcriptional regulator with XRE-family HTH domain